MRRFEFSPRNVPKPQDEREIRCEFPIRLEVPMGLPIEGSLDGWVESETEGTYRI